MISTIRSNGGKPMASDTEAKKRWDKENTTKVLLKLNHNTDKDLLEYLNRRKENGESMAGAFKEALRYKIMHEGE